MLFLLLAACDLASTTPPVVPVPPPVAEVVPPVAATTIPPEPTVGVREIEVPAHVVRATNIRDEAPPPRLEVQVNFDHSSFAELGKLLEQAGFILLDGDGEVWRVQAPAGRLWSERLTAMPEVYQVTSTLDRDLLPSGNFREGGATFGTFTQSFSFKEGGPVTSIPGFVAPEPAIPGAAERSLVRCLSPLRTELLDGVTAGPGWERALILSPPSWVLVVSSYGPCAATGWVVMSPDAGLEGLSVGSEPASEATADTYHELARRYLSFDRGVEDEAAAAAFDILRAAPDAVLARHVTELAPSLWQGRLYEELERRLPEAALAVASTSTSPVLLGQAAGQDPALRERLLSSADTSSYVLREVVGMAPAAVLERLRLADDPVLRSRAWDTTFTQIGPNCQERVRAATTLPEAVAVYEACPMPAVRSQAFQKVQGFDKKRAGELVEATLSAPETVETGVNAVRHANALERDDLLAAVVARNSVSREVRLAALTTLNRTGRYPGTAALTEKHGMFLGFRELPGTGDAAALGGRP